MEGKNIKELIWDIFNYSTFYIVVFDENMKIVLANYAFAIALGFSSEDELVGKKWSDFISEEEKSVAEKVFKSLRNGNISYEEYSGKTKTKSDSPLYIRWFSTFLDNHIKCIVNVGIPLECLSPEQSIDSVRAFYKDILEKDSKMIQTMKESIGIHLPVEEVCEKEIKI